jgi:hypothetical protein
MNQKRMPFINLLTKYLLYAEQFFLGVLIVAMLMPFFKVQSGQVINISLLGLATVFFLYAYKPLEIERSEGKKLEFTDLLATTILPKVMWISCAVSTIGILFYVVHLATESYQNMLMLGGGSLLIGIICLGVFVVSGMKHVNALHPLLFRSLPLLLIDLFILMR